VSVELRLLSFLLICLENLLPEPNLLSNLSFRPGLEKESHAIHLARLYNLSPSVIDRAKYVSGLALRHDLARLSLELNQEVPGGSTSFQDSSEVKAEDESRFQNPNLLPTSKEVREAEAKVRKFLEWDLEFAEDEVEMGMENEDDLSPLKQKLKLILDG